MFASSIGEATFSSPLPSVDKIPKSHFGTWSSSKSRNRTRPPSHGSLELEKLLRIKSEIQVNLSKKMDKFKAKVTQSPGLSKSTRSSSGGVFVDPKSLQTDCPSSSPSTSRHMNDSCLYGDDWSSESDLDEESKYGGSNGAYSSGSSNYAIGKSKSASHASSFWKSIDSALTLGRRNKDQNGFNKNSNFRVPLQTVTLRGKYSLFPTKMKNIILCT